MRRSVVALFTVKEATESYLDYLRYADKELPSLQELFPKASADAKEIVGFHQQLCDTMEKNGIPFKGIKVVSPSHDPARMLRAKSPLCVPVFSCFFDDEIVPAKQYRLQYVEGGICFTLDSELDSHAAPKPAEFSAAIELTGTRFPFYPPTLSGFICDLCSIVRVTTGRWTRLSKENSTALANYSFVLTKDSEPVEVGGGRLFLDDPIKAVPLAVEYAKELGISLNENHVVLCSGLTPRIPSHPGNYTLQWGVYGSARCTIA